MEKDAGAGKEFYFQWHLTERCNLHCTHCYQSTSLTSELAIEDLFLVVGELERALTAWQRIGTLSLTGGEPFLRRNDLFALMNRIDSSPAFQYYDILTNGSLLAKDNIALLRAHKKLRRVQVSIEGATAQSNDAIRGAGSFDTTIRAIHLLDSGGIPASVMVTLSRRNLAEIGPIVDLAARHGVSTLAFERLIPEGRGMTMSDQILSPEELRSAFATIFDHAMRPSPVRILLYRPLYAYFSQEDPTVGALCSAGNNALTLMPDGTVYPCRRLPIPIGNVLADGLFSIWYGSDVLWTLRNPTKLAGKCRGCHLLTNCRGCRAMAYFSCGDYMAEDPQCWI